MLERPRGRLSGELARARYIWRFARLVRERTRFARAEYAGRPAVAVYRSRRPTVEFAIRHRSGDLYILEQAFGDRDFEWPSEVQARLAGHAPVRVLDLGAHIGLFSAHTAATVPRAEITAFEPDEENRRLLELMITRNGFGARVRVVAACAAAENGTALFEAGLGSTSHIVFNGAPKAGVREVETRDVLPFMQVSDLVKIDIEGGEWPILRDPRFGGGRTRALLMEYHPAPGVDDARAEALRALEAAGFATRHVEQSGPGTGMFWAWR